MMHFSCHTECGKDSFLPLDVVYHLVELRFLCESDDF